MLRRPLLLRCMFLVRPEQLPPRSLRQRLRIPARDRRVYNPDRRLIYRLTAAAPRHRSLPPYPRAAPATHAAPIPPHAHLRQPDANPRFLPLPHRDAYAHPTCAWEQHLHKPVVRHLGTTHDPDPAAKQQARANS